MFQHTIQHRMNQKGPKFKRLLIFECISSDFFQYPIEKLTCSIIFRIFLVALGHSFLLQSSWRIEKVFSLVWIIYWKVILDFSHRISRKGTKCMNTSKCHLSEDGEQREFLFSVLTRFFERMFIQKISHFDGKEGRGYWSRVCCWT